MISPHIKAVGRLDSINNDSEGRTLARGQKKKKKKFMRTVYMERLASGKLLDNSGNPTQYSLIIYTGKESEKEWMCVYI